MNSRPNRCFVIVLTLLFIVPISCSHKMTRVELFTHPGLQWLSWTPTERENYVYGFTDGYEWGVHEACLAADRLFERNIPHTIGYDNVPSTLPSARCDRSVPGYSKIGISLSTGPDYSPYVTAITDFYTKHPDYRDTPLIQLMSYLEGTNNVTAEELYFHLTGQPQNHPDEATPARAVHWRTLRV
jgi:energy-converting hydrogenase Eha subunit F